MLQTKTHALRKMLWQVRLPRSLAYLKCLPLLLALLLVLPRVSIAGSNYETTFFKNISGTITDQQGSPVAGVSVKVKGKSGGVQTDAAGKFSIDAQANDILQITAVGYKTTEVTVDSRDSYSLSLEQDFSEMEQVIVVGYGTQKKVNLTGSVAQVGGAELTKRPGTNVQNLLQGKVSGLQVTQASGKPGSDGAQLRIRGLGSFNAGSEPLVLIDGVRGDMMALNPDDIESVSVLKDAASAAIYGARAANGVILVNTKRGRSKDVVIQYHGNVQAQQATRLPELLTNSADYMTYWNQANTRSGLVPYFSQQEIDAFRNSNDPVKYPNFNWVDHVFKTAVAHNHHLSVSGGNEKTTFNLGVGYLDQGGIVSIYNLKKYNLLFSLDSKIKNWLTIGGNVQLTKRDVQEDNFGDNDYVMSAYSGPNYTPTVTLPNGSTGYVARYSANIGEWTVRNPDALIASGFRKMNYYNIRPQLYTDVKLTKDLLWQTKAGIGYNTEFNKRFEHPVDNYYFNDGSYAHNNAVWQQGVRDLMSQTFETTLFSTLNYKKSFGRHDLNVLAGYSQETNYYRELRGSKLTFPTNTISELDGGNDLGQSTAGTAHEWAIQSFFGRLMYDFQGKYLFEANARYDGTSRFAPGNRWGLFPSLSAGWRVSEESFLRSATWMDNLKLRASWGRLGNQNVTRGVGKSPVPSPYIYQPLLFNTSYPFDGLMPGIQLTNLVDQTLKWETTTVLDFGIDLSIKNGLFYLTADWFDKITKDIIYPIQVPASIGLSSPTVNFAKMRNRGWEFEVGHRNKIGPVNYDVNFNFTTFKNEVLYVNTTSYPGNKIVKVGLPFESHYLIPWEGIFQSQDDIDKSAEHPYNPQPGDLKYKDSNTDGVINAEDREVVSGAYPKFYYGGSLNLSWNGFDLSAFFQGLEGFKHYIGGTHMAWGFTPYTQGSPPTLDFIKNMWTPENPSNTTPAIYHSQYRPNTGTASSYWLVDGSYLRLKNLSIGYTFRNGLTQRMGLKGLRLYVTGDNLITVTDYPGADPERSCTGCRFSVYPQVTTYAVGVKATL